MVDSFQRNLGLLLKRFPDALMEILRSRGPEIGVALQELEEDHFEVLESGHLYRSDREVWSGVWDSAGQGWVDMDDAERLRELGVLTG